MKEENLTYFFEPLASSRRDNPYQQNIIDFFHAGKKIVVAPVSNKVGKTAVSSNIIISWCLGYEPWSRVPRGTIDAVEIDGEFFRASSLGKSPPVRIRVTGEDWTHSIGQTIIPELIKWAPRGAYTTRKNSQGVEYLWKWHNGSTIEIMCIRPDQRVLMGDLTEKPIKDVSVGDVVVCSDGLTTVTKIHTSHSEAFYRITTRLGSEIVCTYKHPILTEDGWKRAIDIRKGDVLIKPEIDYERDFEIEDWKLVVLGILIGDGHIGEKEVRWTCYSSALVAWVEGMLPDNLKIHPVSKHPGEYAITQRVSRNNSPVISLLRESGLLGKKSADKFIPDLIFKLSKRQKGLFLKALFSTDGTFTPAGHQITYSSRSEKLVEDVKKLLRHIGVTSQAAQYYRTSHFDGYDCSGFVHVCRFGSRESILNFAEYAGFIGKNNSWEDFVSVYKSRFPAKYPKKNVVTLIEIIDGGDCLDLTVSSESHNYIVDGMIVHNTHDQDVKLFESWLGDGWWPDEPPPYPIWSAMARGLFMTGGKVLMPTTPLKEAWVLDELVLSGRPDVGVIDDVNVWDNSMLYDHDMEELKKVSLGDDDIEAYFKESMKSKQGPTVLKAMLIKIHGEIEGDVIWGDLIPNLYIERFVQDIADEDRMPRLFGQFKSLVGRVVKEYDPDIHDVEPFDIPTDWPVVAGIDFHLEKPHAISYYTINPSSMEYVIDEVFENMSSEDIADDIIRKKRKNTWRLEMAFIDPLSKGDLGFMKNRMTNQGNMENSFTIIRNKLSKHGIILEVGSKDKVSGIDNIRRKFKGPNGLPTLFFFDHCNMHRHQMMRWVFDDKGKPKKENDDFPENLYRWTNFGIKYTDPIEMNREPKYMEMGIV